jgi:ISXO2-like transposase domain
MVSGYPFTYPGESGAIGFSTQAADWRIVQYSMKQKVMQVMKERDDGKPLSGVIQLDDVYWGGKHRGGKRGRVSANKTPFAAAVALNDNGHPISMNMNVVKGFQATEIARWAKQHLEPGSLVYSDGLLIIVTSWKPATISTGLNTVKK